MQKTISLMAIAAALTLGGVANAAHNNSWADADDVVMAKKHDSRQEKSANTPGEDEMKGDMRRDADDKAAGRRDGDGGAGRNDGSGAQSGGKGGKR